MKYFPSSSYLPWILLLLLPMNPAAQATEPPQTDKPWTSWEKPAFDRAKAAPVERNDREMDVLLYDLDLTVSSEEVYLEGSVGIEFQLLAEMDTLVFDLANAGLSVSEVELDEASVTFLHQDDLLMVPLDPAAPAGQVFQLSVDYSGRPARAGLLGYSLRHLVDEDSFLDPSQPVVATLSEPDAAHSWWPCHDTPYDAAEVILSVVAPDTFTLASAGVKTVDELLGEGMRRQTWHMPTPIPAYLVSIALSKYEQQWEESVTVHTWPDETPVEMPVEYYCNEIEYPDAAYTWSKTTKMIQTFEELFGPYPFADLKYGMALFVFGGAMEHPTMSSMGRPTVSLAVDDFTGGSRSEWIVAHELAHQWFGDCLRVERWGEIWLNEGFARYGEVLWLEEEYGMEHGERWIQGLRRDLFTGTLQDPDQLFGSTSYNKGAWVLHMLRQVMGRQALLTAMRNYMTDPLLRFQPVASTDFQAHCEVVYAENPEVDDPSLDWFFDPWLTQVGRPALDVFWAATEMGVRLQVDQPADRSWRLPLPIRLQYADSTTEDMVFWVDGSSSIQEFTIAGEVVWIEVDPLDRWLIDAEIHPGHPTGLIASFPNPADGFSWVNFILEREENARVELFDLRGRRVRTLADGLHSEGYHQYLWDGKDRDGTMVARGIYFVRLHTDSGVQQTQKLTWIR